MSLKGFYINLKKRTDRKNLFEKLKQKFNFFKDIQRFEAIEHDNGAIGCGKSHIEVLKLLSNVKENYVAVLEDDLIVIDENHLNSFIKDFEKVKNTPYWDIIILTPYAKKLDSKPFMKQNNFFRIFNNKTTTGMIIKKKWLHNLIDSHEEAIKSLENNLPGKKFAIDQYWCKLQTKHNFYCYNKWCFGHLPGYSDIAGRKVNHNRRYAGTIKKLKNKTTLPFTNNNKKIFIIGFNKTGTSTLHNYFIKNSIPSIHWDNGKIATKIEYNYEHNNKLLTGYEKYIVFSDMENYIYDEDIIYAYVTYFKEMDRQYPESKFILNIRNVDNWIKSRNRHMNRNYTKIICKKLNLNEKELNDKWRDDFYNHKNNVIKYFSDKHNKLLVFDIEKDSVQKLNDFFPELQLNSKLYTHEAKTR